MQHLPCLLYTSFAEFYSVYDGDYDDAWDDYMIYGGLPQIVSFQSERQKADYLKNIFANVYLKDVICLLYTSEEAIWKKINILVFGLILRRTEN